MAKPRGLDVLDPRDGPNEYFKAKHATTSRAKGGGRRVKPRLEQLVMSDAIAPDEYDAGARFKRDHDNGVVGRGKSCLDDSVKTTGNWGPADHRLDTNGLYYDAVTYLDNSDLLSPRNWKPSQILNMFCVCDESFQNIGAIVGVDGEKAKSLICRYLKKLTEYYREIDKTAPVSHTAHTKELIQKRVDPEDDC